MKDLFKDKIKNYATDSLMERFGIYLDTQAPNVNSLSTWMTDIKKHPKIGNLMANQIAIPGAHHAGLTYILPYFELFESFFGALGLEDLFKTKSNDFISRLVTSLTVP